MSKAIATVVARKSDGAEPAVQPKGARAGGRIHVQMVQNVLLVWLDNNIDESSSDCQNTITQLRHVVNNVNIFTDAEQCIDFLGDMEKEKACMLISGALGQQIVPLVHNMIQVDSIFIFCCDRKYHNEWVKDWLKIKGIFTDIQSICKALEAAARQYERNAISISIMGTGDDLAKKSLDQLDPSFMYTQIMKEILLSIPFDSHHIEEFLRYCRQVLASNEGQLKHVDKLERQYRDQTPIWWYTCDCCLYSMLNRALRMMDADLIIKLGFFISDLHRQIEQLHKKQFGSQSSGQRFTVYRGQEMAKDDFHKMVATKGGLLSFNSFLSTSKDHKVSLIYVRCDPTNADIVGVLFIMTIDPAQSTTPFAYVSEFSNFGGAEEEVLFSMHAVFRIGEITSMGDNHCLVRVELTLTSNKENDLRQLTDRIREETYPDEEGWYRLGLVLYRMGQHERAQQVYEILLEQAIEESAKGPIYNQLGLFKQALGEYPEAIAYYETGLQIKKKRLPCNHPDLAMSYNNIGIVYRNMGDYPRALSSYEKALAIQQQSLSPNHPDLAASYNNIGIVYHHMGDYSKALSSYEKALAIRQQSLPPNHPDLAASYNNIGIVYRNMGDYPRALSSYEKALAIRQQSLPPNHPDLAMSYNNIGIVYQNMGDYSKALSSYEKALAIRQQSLPPNHPDLAASDNNIGLVYQNMGDYSKALSSYEKALAIQQQSLPPNHPDLAASYNNIGIVYHHMGDYSKALSSYEKALAIRQQSLPPNHPDLAASYNNIGIVYHHMGDYSKALSSYEKALAIQQQSLPPNHPDLAASYNNIGSVYYHMGDYPKAVSSHEKALAIRQQSLPPNRPALALSHYNTGLLYKKMGNYVKAHFSHERAVDIAQYSLPSDHPDLRDYRKELANIKKKL